MDVDSVAGFVGPTLLVAGMLLLLYVVVRPAPRSDRTAITLQFADADNDVHPGLEDDGRSHLPRGASRVLAGLTEVTPSPRNTTPMTTTRRDSSRVSSETGDPDTGVIRVVGREAVRRDVPDTSIGSHPARRPA